MKTSTPYKQSQKYSVISSRCKRRLYYEEVDNENQSCTKKVKVTKATPVLKAPDFKEESTKTLLNGEKVCRVEFKNHAMIIISIYCFRFE